MVFSITLPESLNITIAELFYPCVVLKQEEADTTERVKEEQSKKEEREKIVVYEVCEWRMVI